MITVSFPGYYYYLPLGSLHWLLVNGASEVVGVLLYLVNLILKDVRQVSFGSKLQFLVDPRDDQGFLAYMFITMRNYRLLKTYYLLSLVVSIMQFLKLHL